MPASRHHIKRKNYRNKYPRVTAPRKPRKKSRFTEERIDEMNDQEFWANLSIEEINQYRRKKINKSNYTISVTPSQSERNYIEIGFASKHHELLDDEFEKNVQQTEQEWNGLDFGENGLPMFDDEKGITTKRKRRIINLNKIHKKTEQKQKEQERQKEKEEEERMRMEIEREVEAAITARTEKEAETQMEQETEMEIETLLLDDSMEIETEIEEEGEMEIETLLLDDYAMEIEENIEYKMDEMQNEIGLENVTNLMDNQMKETIDLTMDNQIKETIDLTKELGNDKNRWKENREAKPHQFKPPRMTNPPRSRTN